MTQKTSDENDNIIASEVTHILARETFFIHKLIEELHFPSC